MEVKETKEALVAVVKLAKVIAALAKDGIDWTDAAVLASKIVGDEVLRSALVEAVSGAAAIPAEVKDISFEEGIELAMAVIAELKA